MANPITEYIRLIRTINRARREGRGEELVAAARENAEIQKIMLRPMRYETVDGAGEIGWGTMLLLFAMSEYSSAVLPKGWVGTGLIGMALCLGGGVAPILICKAIKRFITWPRTGYVAIRRDTKSYRAMIITVVLLSVGFGVGITFLMRPEIRQMAAHHAANGPAASSGNVRHVSDKVLLRVVVVSNALLYLMMAAASIGKLWWKWIVFTVIAVGSAAICLVERGGFLQVMPVLMLFLGPMWLGSGLATLFYYLRHSKPPELQAV